MVHLYACTKRFPLRNCMMMRKIICGSLFFCCAKQQHKETKQIYKRHITSSIAHIIYIVSFLSFFLSCVCKRFSCSVTRQELKQQVHASSRSVDQELQGRCRGWVRGGGGHQDCRYAPVALEHTCVFHDQKIFPMRNVTHSPLSWYWAKYITYPRFLIVVGLHTTVFLLFWGCLYGIFVFCF